MGPDLQINMIARLFGKPRMKAGSVPFRRPQAARNVTVILGAAMLVIGVVAGINIGIDTNDYFGSQREREDLQNYLTHMRQAEHGVLYTYNDRPVKLALLRQSSADCVVIGSSHVMTYQRDRHPLIQQNCKRLDNAGVSGASFEDVVALLGVVKENKVIKQIFLGIDLWSFKRNTRRQWYHIAEAVRQGRRDFDLDPSFYTFEIADSFEEKMAKAFSFSYLMQNWTALKRALRGLAPLSYDARPLSQADLRTELALFADGSFGYPSEFKPSPRDAEITISDQWTDPPYFDPIVVAEMHQTLAILQKEGRKVTLLISPYHPVVLQCAKADICESMRVVDPIVRSLAKDLGIEVVGGFDPTAFSVTRASFLDFQHLRGSELHKLTTLVP